MVGKAAIVSHPGPDAAAARTAALRAIATGAEQPAGTRSGLAGDKPKIAFLYPGQGAQHRVGRGPLNTGGGGREGVGDEDGGGAAQAANSSVALSGGA